MSPSSNDAPRGPLHIGLSAWIVQDGNYEDFAVGDKRQFALEFYAKDGFRIVSNGPPQAELMTDHRYRIRGRVVFAAEAAWVIDTGTFMAYAEREPPSNAVVGTWIEGEVYIGIDPFFYFEYLHRMDAMPPLAYSWRIEQILLETTPLIETRDEQGRTVRARDPSRVGFVVTQATQAWTDDDGNGSYFLVCERIGGPVDARLG